jgi:putative colanic acid biosynthesis acetyltransferase WcaF
MSSNEYKNRLSFKNQAGRAIWVIIYYILFRPFGTKIFRVWRNFLLRLFGAKIHNNAGVYASAIIWCPWNLEMSDNAWLGPHVNCYNVALIQIGKDSTVSQGAFLCTASHNINSKAHELITKPINIESQAWIAADAFIGPGVNIGQGAVVGARACVFKNVEPWMVVGGNPAKFIKYRVIHD